MSQKFPWDDLRSPVYVSIEVKQRKKWVIVYAWFCVCLLAAGAVLTKYHIMCAVFAVFLALAIVTKRTEAVTERGLESCTDIKLYTSSELWSWDEIEALTYEKNDQVKDVTLLFFTKGPRTRKAFFKDADAEMIKILARKKKIKIYNGSEYRAEERAYSASQKRR